MFRIVGDAADNPAVQESARRMRRRYHIAALTLLEKLLIDGAEQSVTIEDIERLAVVGETSGRRSPEFMRKIVVKLMVGLRPK